jgi:hypothetical protein
MATLLLGPFALHATLWAPLEAQRPEGPVLLCRDCLMAWTVTLPAQDQAHWQDALDSIKAHVETHEGQPPP